MPPEQNTLIMPQNLQSKKRIAIFCVCYNSYEILDTYFERLDEAAKNARNNVATDLFIADNTQENIRPIDYTPAHFSLRVFPFHENLGYFGAIGRMMKATDCAPYDYVIISNTDVFMRPETLCCISDYPATEHVGWIAPLIYSEREKKDRNPQAAYRYSRKRLQLLRLMYKFPLLHYIYASCFYKIRHLTDKACGKIYAGHGSFIILTAAYIKQCGSIDYPVFLYGEEIYLAENCRLNNLDVIHTTEIQVYDLDHYTTSKMKRSFYYRCHYDAIDYILKQYYS